MIVECVNRTDSNKCGYSKELFGQCKYIKFTLPISVEEYTNLWSCCIHSFCKKAQFKQMGEQYGSKNILPHR